jgi:hypothetical protein
VGTFCNFWPKHKLMRVDMFWFEIQRTDFISIMADDVGKNRCQGGNDAGVSHAAVKTPKQPQSPPTPVFTSVQAHLCTPQLLAQFLPGSSSIRGQGKHAAAMAAYAAAQHTFDGLPKTWRLIHSSSRGREQCSDAASAVSQGSDSIGVCCSNTSISGASQLQHRAVAAAVSSADPQTATWLSDQPGCTAVNCSQLFLQRTCCCCQHTLTAAHFRQLSLTKFFLPNSSCMIAKGGGASWQRGASLMASQSHLYSTCAPSEGSSASHFSSILGQAGSPQSQTLTLNVAPDCAQHSATTLSWAQWPPVSLLPDAVAPRPLAFSSAQHATAQRTRPAPGRLNPREACG